MKKQIFHDTAKDLSFKPNWMFNRFLIYGTLIIWAFICLFPIYWTITTTFKAAPDVMKGNIVPWLDFTPKWLGLKSLGLSPNTIFVENTVREEFLKRFFSPLFIILIGLSSSLIVMSSKNENSYKLKNVFYFCLGVLFIIISELSLRYAEVNINYLIVHFLIPVLLFILIYSYIFFYNYKAGRN